MFIYLPLEIMSWIGHNFEWHLFTSDEPSSQLLSFIRTLPSDVYLTAHLFMGRALLKISNNYVTKCGDRLIGFILPALCYTGRCWPLPFGIFYSQGFQYPPPTPSPSHHPCLPKSPAILCPLRCWFPQSSILGSPLALLVLLSSHVLTQFSYQPMLWWPWGHLRQPLILGDSFSHSSLQHVFLNVSSTPQLGLPACTHLPVSPASRPVVFDRWHHSVTPARSRESSLPLHLFHPCI